MHLSPSLKSFPTAVALATLAAAMAAPSVASAHALLISPKPRDNRSDHKDSNGGAPCGIARATTQPMNAAMAPGSMFNVTWGETVNHTGCFVIDFAMANDQGFTTLATVPHNGASPAPTTAKPRMYSQMVTLPSTPCTACTLRLRQLMIGNTEPAAGTCPPATVPTDATYYSCANIVIGDSGGTGTGGSGAGSGGSGAGTGGSGAGSGGRSGTGGRANTGGTTGSSGGSNPGSGGATTSSGGASNPGSGGATTSSGGATNPGSGGAVTSSGGASNPGSGGASNPGSGGATTTPGTGGAAGPGGTADEPPPPCACGVATPRSLATGALLFGLLLGMTVVRGRARRKTKHNQ